MKVKDITVEYTNSFVKIAQSLDDGNAIYVASVDEYDEELGRFYLEGVEELEDFIQRLTELKKLFK